jgi:hypothetical protein
MEGNDMRYENLSVDVVDVDFLDFTSEECEGNVVLYGDNELIHILNEIRSEQGNTDLVGVDYDNEVYYEFYLMFNTQKKRISIQGVCNYGEKDDEVWYELPMTKEEERHAMFVLLESLAHALYIS